MSSAPYKIPHLSNIKAATLNVCSIRNKADLIIELFTDLNLDIMCITETWLNLNDTPIIATLNTNTLSFVHLPRPSSHFGGGLGVLYNKCIKLISYKDLYLEHSEAFSCTFHPNNSLPLTIITIYRPPHQSIPHFIEELDTLLYALTPKTILTGDFNIPITSTSHNSRHLYDILESHNLSQKVTTPTHTANNILDLVISNKSSDIISNTVTHNLITDHYIVLFNIHVPKPTRLSKTIKIRNIAKIDISKFMEDFINNIYICGNNKTLSHFDYILSSTLDVHAPIKQKSIIVRDNSKWFNNNLVTEKRKLRKAEKCWRRSKSTTDFDIFLLCRQQYRSLLKTTKENYYTDLLTNAGKDYKKIFKISNTLLGRLNRRILPDTSILDNINNFDIFFTAKVNDIITSLPSPLSYVPTIPPYSLSLLNLPSTSLVEKLLLSVKSTCSLDPIPVTLLHKLIPYIVMYYKEIIEESIISGSVPSCMKLANVTPTIKKPDLDKSLLASYRPISHLSYISKVLERVVAIQLNDYILSNKILNKFQSAYTKKKNTETALVYIINSLQRASFNKHSSVIILLDLSAAFDTLDHSTLMLRLQSIGINGTALEWFKSYLQNRYFSIQIDSLTSTPRSIHHGVPQGSVLGPILFNIYMIPIFDIFNKYPNIGYHSYADDLQVYMILKDPTKDIPILNNCLEDIRTWLNSNSLSLNSSKTIALHISLSNKSTIPNIYIGNDCIPYSRSARNLGIILDTTLSFTHQISNIIKSVNFILYTIKIIRPSISTEIAKLLITSLILPKLDYCNSIINGIPDYLLHKLQLLQNSAVRLIYNINKFSRTHISPYMKILHWLPIKYRIIYKICMLTHHATHHSQPDYLHTLLTPYTSSRPIRLCLKYTLVIPDLRNVSIKQKRAFSISAPIAWNRLPYNIRSIQSTMLFKNKLKTYLFSLAYPNNN